MSENSSKWYQRQFQKILCELQKYQLSMDSKNHALELLSAFLWVMMVLWMELSCLILVGYMCVSLFIDLEIRARSFSPKIFNVSSNAASWES